MNTPTKNMFREQDELEGALLLPVAHAVAVEDANLTYENLPIARTSTSAASIPVSSFWYDDVTSKEQEEEMMIEYNGFAQPNPVREAFTLPSSDTCHDEERDRAQRIQAQLKGRIEADQEREAISIQNCKVDSINYFASKDIGEGNDCAVQKDRMDRLGLTQMAITTTTKTQLQAQPKKEAEFFNGTYGKGYQISEYETSEYSTNEYSVKEYKSVYDP